MKDAFHNRLFEGLFLIVAGLQVAFSAPQINNISGAAIDGGQLVISGTAFGIKSPAKPVFWAPLNTSIAPSPLGTVTSWAEIQSMTFAANQGINGGGALMSSDSSGTWTARVDADTFYWSAPGQKMYLYRKLKHNFSPITPTNFNWKDWRVWGNLNGGNATSLANNIYNGNLNPDNASEIESGDNLYPYTNLAAAFGTVGEWNTNQILMRMNTNATGPGNGFFQYVTNGAVYGQVPYEDWQGTRNFKLWDSDTDPMLRRNYVVHGVKANHTMAAGDRYWATSVYLDKTWARVIIGDAATFSASKQQEIQIPSVWSDGAITVTVNLHAFPSDKPAYLFVIDSDNTPSNGYLIHGRAPLPPTGVTVQ